MHRDGRNAELLAGAQHPQGDFAAIGDQDFIEHRFGPANAWSLAPSFDDDQRLAEFHRLAVLEQNLDHSAGARRRNLVHGFHRFDDEQRIAGLHIVPISMNGLAPGSGLP